MNHSQVSVTFNVLKFSAEELCTDCVEISGSFVLCEFSVS